MLPRAMCGIGLYGAEEEYFGRAKLLVEQADNQMRMSAVHEMLGERGAAD